MGFQPDIRIPLDNIEVGVRPGGPFKGGTFSLQDFIAVGDRAFVDVLFCGEEDDQRFVYELGDFQKSDLGSSKITKDRLGHLQEKYLNGLQAALFQESRLVKLNDDEPMEQCVSERLLKSPPPASQTDVKSSPATPGGHTVTFAP